MSLRNFGAALSGLASGIPGGMQLGENIRTARDANQIRKINKDGMAEAQRSAPDDPMNYFYKNTAPQIAQTYIKQGRPEKAEAWQQFLSTKKSQQAVSDWSGAFMDARMGNWDDAATKFGQYYIDNFQDGFSIDSKKINKDKGGKVTGFTFGIKSPDGQIKEKTMTTEDFTTLAMASNPQALFEYAIKSEGSARSAAMQNQMDINKENRKFKRDAALKGIDHQYKMIESESGQGQDMTADQRNVLAMVKAGAAKDEAEAWKILQTRSAMEPREWALQYAKMAESAQPKFGDERKSFAELLDEGLEIYSSDDFGM